MADGALPIDRHGVLALPQLTNRHKVAQFLEHRAVTDEILLELLQEKFVTFMQAAVARDEATVSSMAEKTFAEKLVGNFDKIAESKLEFVPGAGQLGGVVKADSTDFGHLRKNLVSDSPETYIIDSLLVQGVSAQREKNMSNFDYSLEQSQEAAGVRAYTHRYFTGQGQYYLMLEQEKILARLDEIGAKLDGKAVKYHSHVTYYKKPTR